MQDRSRNSVFDFEDLAQRSFIKQPVGWYSSDNGGSNTDPSLPSALPPIPTRSRVYNPLATRVKKSRKRRRSGEKRNGRSSRRFKSVCRRVDPTFALCWFSRSSYQACCYSYCCEGEACAFHFRARDPIRATTDRSQDSIPSHAMSTQEGRSQGPGIFAWTECKSAGMLSACIFRVTLEALRGMSYSTYLW